MSKSKKQIKKEIVPESEVKQEDNNEVIETVEEVQENKPKKKEVRLAAAVCLHIAVALELVAGKMRALDDSEQDFWA